MMAKDTTWPNWMESDATLISRSGSEDEERLADSVRQSVDLIARLTKERDAAIAMLEDANGKVALLEDGLERCRLQIDTHQLSDDTKNELRQTVSGLIKTVEALQRKTPIPFSP